MVKAGQYDEKGCFLWEVDADEKSMGHNCFIDFPPQTTEDGSPIPEKHVFRRVGPGKFELVENHIGQEGYIGTEAHIITELGPLPPGWFEYPEPNADEIDAEARAYVLAQLAALDVKYLTPRILAGLATGDEYALGRLREHEEEAELWRERLAAIPTHGGEGMA